MTDHLQDDRLDELVRQSPTALAAAVERAIATGDRALERAALAALGELGIVVVDRTTLVESINRAQAGRSL